MINGGSKDWVVMSGGDNGKGGLLSSTVSSNFRV